MIIKTIIGISIIAMIIVATYVIGCITRRITESQSPSTWEWETTMTAGFIGWMVIGAMSCLLAAAYLLGEVVLQCLT
jgi:hypothetical protein